MFYYSFENPIDIVHAYIIKLNQSICHGKKDTAFDMLDSIRVAKSVEQRRCDG